MDLAGIAAQMRLDALTVEASRCLVCAGVAHVLLKGPTTARWLYDPPRPYRDVDMLVPASEAEVAVDALRRAGVAHPSAGELGEEAHHSRLLLSPRGFELDLHVTLPSTPVPGAEQQVRLWEALQSHIEPFDLDGTAVPALDLPGRFLVVALHALASPGEGQAAEDLRRAAAAGQGDVATAALALARALSIERPFVASLAVATGEMDRASLPLEYRLLDQGAAGAYQLHRLAGTPLLSLPGRLWKEAFPSVGFMRHAYPGAITRSGLWRAYFHRLLRLTHEMPGQLRILWHERHTSRSSKGGGSSVRRVG